MNRDMTEQPPVYRKDFLVPSISGTQQSYNSTRKCFRFCCNFRFSCSLYRADENRIHNDHDLPVSSTLFGNRQKYSYFRIFPSNELTQYYLCDTGLIQRMHWFSAPL